MVAAFWRYIRVMPSLQQSGRLVDLTYLKTQMTILLSTSIGSHWMMRGSRCRKCSETWQSYNTTPSHSTYIPFQLTMTSRQHWSMFQVALECSAFVRMQSVQNGLQGYLIQSFCPTKWSKKSWRRGCWFPQSRWWSRICTWWWYALVSHISWKRISGWVCKSMQYLR